MGAFFLEKRAGILMFTGFAACQGVAEVEAMEIRPIREQEDMGYRFRKNFLKIV